MAEQEYISAQPTRKDKTIERPKQRQIKDGINDHLRSTIFDDYEYGKGKTSNTLPYQKSERKQALRNGRSKPSRRLNAQGQDYVTRDKEHMGRNPDGSKRILPKNKSSTIRPS